MGWTVISNRFMVLFLPVERDVERDVDSVKHFVWEKKSLEFYLAYECGFMLEGKT